MIRTRRRRTLGFCRVLRVKGEVLGRTTLVLYYDTDITENDASNSSSIVACVLFVDKEIFTETLYSSDNGIHIWTQRLVRRICEIGR